MHPRLDPAAATPVKIGLRFPLHTSGGQILPRLLPRFWISLLLLIQAPLHGADVPSLAALTNASVVAHLHRKDAALAHAVKLTAVVTYADPAWGLLFVHDSSGGVFVALDGKTPPTHADLVEIVGRTGTGSFQSVVAEASWRRLGSAPMPEPRRIDQPERFAREIDCEWSELVGVVRAVSMNPARDHVQLEVVDRGWRARVFLPATGTSDPAQLDSLLDATISVTGVAGIDYDEAQGIIGLKLFVPSQNLIRALEQPPADPFQLALLPLKTVRGYSGTNTPVHRVHLRGIVTSLNLPGELVLQENRSAVRVSIPAGHPFRLGDALEVGGYIGRGTFSPLIEDAMVRRTQAALRTEPTTVAPASILWGDYDAQLVSVTGTLQSISPTATNTWLVLLQDDIRFGVSIPTTADTEDWPGLKEGDVVRATGVCAVQGNNRGAPQSFSLLLRSAADVVRLPRIRVFSIRQVTILIAAVAAAGGLALLWGMALRRRVREQTHDLAHSLSLLNAALESTADAILVVDRNGAVASYNSRFARMWNLPEDLLASKDDARLLAFAVAQLKDGEAFLQRVRELYATPEAESFDTLEFKDGRIIERLTQPQRLNGECVGRVWCFRDVTDRKRADEDLHWSKERLRATINTSPHVAVQWYDEEGRVTFWNHASEVMFGWKAEEAMGHTLARTILTSETAAQYLEVLRVVARTGEPVGPLEYVFRRQDGSSGVCLSTTFTIPSPSGRPCFVCMDVDITARKQTEQQNLLLAQTLKSARDSVCVTDLQNRILFVNQTFLDTYGFTESEVLNKDVRMLRSMGKDSGENEDEILRRTLKDGWHGELVNRRKDGSEFLTELWTSLVLDNNGTPTAMVGVARDITERKRLEQALAANEARLKAVVEAAPECVKVVSADGILLEMNAAGLRILEAESLAEAKSQPLTSFIAPEHQADFKKVHERVMLGESATLEYVVVGLKGGRRWLATHAVPLRDPASGRVDLVAVTRDITERKRAEKERERLEAQNRQLQKSESLGRMAAAIAHHFNNQLQAVLGNLELATHDVRRIAPASVELLSEAMQSAHRAADVSSLMLTYLGQTPAKHELHDLSEICRRSLSLHRAGMPNNMVLETDLATPGPAIIGSANQIQQILTNLVTNACEAMKESHGTLRLSVKTVPASEIPTGNRFPTDWQKLDTPYACLEVADTGCGIEAADIEMLFDPFFSRKFAGRGMGLAVVLGIVRAHHGVVTVTSTPQHGSVFGVFLPIAAETVASKPKLASPPARSSGAGTVLVVEDEQVVRKLVGRMLTRAGYTVLAAEDGVEAVEIMRQHLDAIGCVLCDLTMPRMNGWETLAALRKLKPGIPVVLSSGHDEARVMEGNHPELPQAFLSKPFEHDQLLKVISQTLTATTGRG